MCNTESKVPKVNLDILDMKVYDIVSKSILYIYFTYIAYTRIRCITKNKAKTPPISIYYKGAISGDFPVLGKG